MVRSGESHHSQSAGLQPGFSTDRGANSDDPALLRSSGILPLETDATALFRNQRTISGPLRRLKTGKAESVNLEKAVRTTDFADGTDEGNVGLERVFIRRVSEESLPSFAEAVIIRVIRTLCLKIFAERANSLEPKGARTLGRFSVPNTGALVCFEDLVRRPSKRPKVRAPFSCGFAAPCDPRFLNCRI